MQLIKQGNKFFGWTLVIISTISILFFFGTRHGSLHGGGYKGTMIPYPYLFGLLGIFIGWCGKQMISTGDKKDIEDAIKQKKAFIDELKTNGVAIKVDLSRCEIKNNNYTNEIEVPIGKDNILIPEGGIII